MKYFFLFLFVSGAEKSEIKAITPKAITPEEEKRLTEWLRSEDKKDIQIVGKTMHFEEHLGGAVSGAYGITWDGKPCVLKPLSSLGERSNYSESESLGISPKIFAKTAYVPKRDNPGYFITEKLEPFESGFSPYSNESPHKNEAFIISGIERFLKIMHIASDVKPGNLLTGYSPSDKEKKNPRLYVIDFGPGYTRGYYRSESKNLLLSFIFALFSEEIDLLFYGLKQSMRIGQFFLDDYKFVADYPNKALTKIKDFFNEDDSRKVKSYGPRFLVDFYSKKEPKGHFPFAKEHWGDLKEFFEYLDVLEPSYEKFFWKEKFASFPKLDEDATFLPEKPDQVSILEAWLYALKGFKMTPFLRQLFYYANPLIDHKILKKDIIEKLKKLQKKGTLEPFTAKREEIKATQNVEDRLGISVVQKAWVQEGQKALSGWLNQLKKLANKEEEKKVKIEALKNWIEEKRKFAIEKIFFSSQSRQWHYCYHKIFSPFLDPSKKEHLKLLPGLFKPYRLSLRLASTLSFASPIDEKEEHLWDSPKSYFEKYMSNFLSILRNILQKKRCFLVKMGISLKKKLLKPFSRG